MNKATIVFLISELLMVELMEKHCVMHHGQAELDRATLPLVFTG